MLSMKYLLGLGLRYPVIIIEFNKYSLSDVEVYYKAARDHRYEHFFKLEIGKNQRYHGEAIAKREGEEENVIFQQFEIFHVDPITGEQRFKRAYRIIDHTKIAKKNRAGADIKIYHKNRNDLYTTPIENIVYFYFTSEEISSGIAFNNWNDGKPLKVALNNNSKIEYDIQPEKYKFLEETGNCQQEPFFQCIAKQLETIEFKNCSKKCLPYVFSNLTAINFSIPFCQDDYNSEENHQIRQRCHSIRQ